MPELKWMRALTTVGVQLVGVVPGSEVASIIGGHWNAIKVFRDTGDSSLLAQYAGIIVGGHFSGGRWVGGYRLLTDPEQVKRWAYQGELDIDDPYEPLAGDR